MSKIETYLGFSIIGFFLIGMLAGCSEHPTHSSDTDLPAATAEQNSPQDIVTTRKVDLSFLSKPKRPIQTPWGIKLVYDPSQDPDVREAYRAYRDSGFSNALEQEINLLDKARSNDRENYKYLGCSSVLQGDCHVWDYFGCEGLEPYKCYVANLPPHAIAVKHCLMNGKDHDSMGFKKIPDFKKSISEYFESECLEWKK